MEAGSSGSASNSPVLAASDGSIASEKRSIRRSSSSSAAPVSGWRAQPLSEEEKAKVMQVLQACDDNDIGALAALATTTYGLVEDEIRRTAWPVLLGCKDTAVEDQVSWRELPVHRDEDQVKLDVNRSFVYYPNDQSEEQLDHRKQELSDLITEVLRRHPELCYFQGYHDIVQVLLLVLGADRAAPAVARLSLLRIRDFMLPSLSAAISHLHLIPPLLYSVDPELYKHTQTAQPFFALSATLTLYAHDIQEYGSIARLFDFLLAREAVVSVYLFAVIILARKSELLDIPLDEPEMLHFTLSKLPQPLDLESLIAQTTTLFARHPPETLPFRAWGRISQYSVLKTTRDLTTLHEQTLQDGERLFAKQAIEIRRQQRIQGVMKEAKKKWLMYQRPIKVGGISVAVVILALWLGRSGRVDPGYGNTGGGMLGASLRRIMAFFMGHR